MDSVSETEIKKEIGKRLRSFREGQNISQEKMAEETGYGKLTIHNYEIGRTMPDLLFLNKLKNKFALNVDYLLEEPEELAGRKDLVSVVQIIEAIDESGIRGIFDNRSKALAALKPYLQKESFEINIVASSMLGLRIQQPEVFSLLEERIKEESVDFNILFTHPEKANFREKQESRREGSIKSEIFESIARLISILREKNLTSKRVSIKFYQGTPTCFLVGTSRMMLVNPYPFETEAYNVFCLLVENNGYIYEQYKKFHFDKPWKSDKSVSLTQYFTESSDDIKALSPNYSKGDLKSYLRILSETLRE